jgi:hypothetical protein
MDLTEKQKAFLDEYGKLREKHLMDFTSFPQFVPNHERNTWELQILPQIVEVESGIPSPFVPNS